MSNTIYTTGASGGFITWTSGTGGWSVAYPTIPVDSIPAVAKKENKDGCNCKKCKEFYPYAEPNQDDGTLVCYSCRHGY